MIILFFLIIFVYVYGKVQPPTDKKRILHECSCFIEFIKRVGKSDWMRGLPSILSLFRNEFNKLNNTGARMSDFIYHMTKIAFFGRENIQDLAIFTQRYNSASCSNSILGTQQMLINAWKKMCDPYSDLSILLHSMRDVIK